MLSKRLLWVLFAAFGLVAVSNAETTIDGKVGTLGLGVELTHEFTPHWGGRVGVNAFSYDFDDSIDSVDYSGDLDLQTFTALMDWLPMAGNFRVSGGVVSNDNQINAAADTSATYDIGSNTYTAAEVGTLGAGVDFDSLVPYAGIGWSNKIFKSLKLTFDLGVLYQGSPNVDLTSTGGTLSADNAFQTELQNEENNFENDLNGFDFYPVASIGMQYAF